MVRASQVLFLLLVPTASMPPFLVIHLPCLVPIPHPLSIFSPHLVCYLSHPFPHPHLSLAQHTVCSKPIVISGPAPRKDQQLRWTPKNPLNVPT
jgi:hypothetical protein